MLCLSYLNFFLWIYIFNLLIVVLKWLWNIGYDRYPVKLMIDLELEWHEAQSSVFLTFAQNAWLFFRGMYWCISTKVYGLDQLYEWIYWSNFLNHNNYLLRHISKRWIKSFSFLSKIKWISHFCITNCRSLAGNPWECTCSLKVFYDKLLELETSSGLVLVDKEKIRCSNMMDVPMFNLNSTAHWCKYSALFVHCIVHFTQKIT